MRKRNVLPEWLWRRKGERSKTVDPIRKKSVSPDIVWEFLLPVHTYNCIMLPGNVPVQTHEWRALMLLCCCLKSDVAVGCPYGGDQQQGMVFIHNGHAGGLKDTPTQVLSGQWASSSFPASFGFALRGDMDIDQNGYPGTRERDSSFMQLLPRKPLLWCLHFAFCRSDCWCFRSW